MICAIANQIKTAPFRKNRKTGSNGLRLNTIKRYSYLLKLVKEYEIEKDTLLFLPLKGAKRYRFAPFFFESTKAQILFL